MIRYNQIDFEVADAAFRKLISHRWYLTEEMVIFALLSENAKITNDIKRNMATSLLSLPQPEEFRRGKPLLHTEEFRLNTELEELIGVESWFLLTTVNINQDGLHYLWLNGRLKKISKC